MEHCHCDCVIKAAGALFLGWNALLFVSWILRNFVTGKNNLRKYGAGKGAWAVVTGASGGIGKEFAVELARRKMNVVIISRSADRMKPVEDEIKSKGVEVRVVEFDFGVADPKAYAAKFASLFKDLDISVLVNNVGINIDYPEMFADHSQGDFEGMVNTNIRSMHQMTHLLIDKLSSRGGAAIINVSSQSATLVAPMLSIYAGTKGYLIAFTKALAAEYKGKKVDVTCITPSMVVSNMSKRKASLDCPMPSAVVNPTLNSLGSGRAVFSPYFGHQVIDFVAGLLPCGLVAGQILKMHKSIRARAIKKRGERQK